MGVPKPRFRHRIAFMSAKPSKRSWTALNWLNFFAADISDGVGPFLAVYLASNLNWQAGAIGMAIAATQLSMVIGQAPAGLVVDRTRRKRLPIILASILVGSVALLWPALRTLLPVLVCQVVLGLAASFYVPSLVALAATTTSGPHGISPFLTLPSRLAKAGPRIFTNQINLINRINSFWFIFFN